jgi:hypothetical protein
MATCISARRENVPLPLLRKEITAKPFSGATTAKSGYVSPFRSAVAMERAWVRRLREEAGKVLRLVNVPWPSPISVEM